MGIRVETTARGFGQISSLWATLLSKRKDFKRIYTYIPMGNFENNQLHDSIIVFGIAPHNVGLWEVLGSNSPTRCTQHAETLSKVQKKSFQTK
jgi:hypothetical protein